MNSEQKQPGLPLGAPPDIEPGAFAITSHERFMTQGHSEINTVQTQVSNVCTVQMGRPKKHENRKAVTVYLSEAEYKWLQLQVGDIPIAAWCRERLLEPTITHIDEAIHLSDKQIAELAKPRQAAKKAQTCVHGTEKGYRCWQCGGLARSE